MSTFFVSVACNTSSFDLNMVLIFTRLQTKGTGQISSFFIFGCFCFGYPSEVWMDWISDFLDPDSGYFQQDQE